MNAPLREETDVSPAAERVIKKCGGAQKVAAITGTSIGTVYKWKAPRKTGGTGGRIPSDKAQMLLDAAQSGNLDAPDLSAEDFFDLEIGGMGREQVNASSAP